MESFEGMYRSSKISNAESDSVDTQLAGSSTDDSRRVDAVAAEILRHFLSDLSATRSILETYRKWSVRSWPFRFFTVFFEILLAWNKPEVNIFFSVIAISLLPSIFLLLFWYVRLLRRTGVLHSEDFPMEDVSRKLEYNRRVVNFWCQLYDSLSSSNDSKLFRTLLYIVMFSALSYIISPNLLLAIFANGFLLSRFFQNNESENSKKMDLSVKSAETGRLSYEVYENQRLWLGNWSDKGLNIGTSKIFPWTDAPGNQISKSTVTPPDENWEWAGLWHADTDGWNFQPILAINRFPSTMDSERPTLFEDVSGLGYLLRGPRT